MPLGMGSPGRTHRPVLSADRLGAVPEGPFAKIRGLIEIVAGALALSCGFFFASFDSMEGRAMACLVMGLYLLRLLFRPVPLTFWRAFLPVIGPVLLAMAWIALAPLLAPGAWLAPDMATGNIVGFHAAVMALLAGALIGYRHVPVVRLIDIWLIIVALQLGLSLLMGTGVLAGPFDVPMFRNGRLTGLAGNANIQAVLAGIALLLTAARVAARLRHQRQPWRALVRNPGIAAQLGLVILCLAVMLYAGSRFPLFVAGLLLAVLGARALARGGTRGGLLRIALITGLVGVISLAGMADVVVRRLGELDVGAAVRTEMWSRYLAAAWRSPWFGYGPGGFPTLNSMLLPDPLVAEAAWTVNSPHNILLQLLLKGGLPYLLFLLAAAAMVAVPVVRHFSGGRRSLEAWGIALALVFLFANGMIDICLDVPATTCFAMFLAGVLWGTARPVPVVGVSKP